MTVHYIKKAKVINTQDFWGKGISPLRPLYILGIHSKCSSKVEISDHDGYFFLYESSLHPCVVSYRPMLYPYL
jgi:hypothetical protein